MMSHYVKKDLALSPKHPQCIAFSDNMFKHRYFHGTHSTNWVGYIPQMPKVEGDPAICSAQTNKVQ